MGNGCEETPISLLATSFVRTNVLRRYKHDRVRSNRVFATKNAAFLRQKGFQFLVKDFRKVQILQLLGKRVFLHPPLIVLGTITTHVWRGKKWDGNNRRFPVWKIREREVRLGISRCLKNYEIQATNLLHHLCFLDRREINSHYCWILISDASKVMSKNCTLDLQFPSSFVHAERYKPFSFFVEMRQLLTALSKKEGNQNRRKRKTRQFRKKVKEKGGGSEVSQGPFFLSPFGWPPPPWELAAMAADKWMGQGWSSLLQRRGLD